MEELKSRWQKYLPIAIGVVGVVLIVGGLIWEKVKPDTKSDIVIEKAVVKEVKDIYVDIEGAVEKPGVYKIPNDSRIGDVLITAGGLSVKADREYVSKSINLAQRVVDGAKIYIPEINKTPPATLGVAMRAGNNTDQSQLININLASEGELDKLPGIGPVTAGKIIAGRPYQTVEELVSKKAVSQSVLDKIKDKITVY